MYEGMQEEEDGWKKGRDDARVTEGGGGRREEGKKVRKKERERERAFSLRSIIQCLICWHNSQASSLSLSFSSYQIHPSNLVIGMNFVTLIFRISPNVIISLHVHWFSLFSSSSFSISPSLFHSSFFMLRLESELIFGEDRHQHLETALKENSLSLFRLLPFFLILVLLFFCLLLLFLLLLLFR